MPTLDKAKYHFQSCEELGADESQGYVHGAIFVAWLANHDLLDVKPGYDDQTIEDCKARGKRPSDFFEWYDGVVATDYMTDEGAAFTLHYYDLRSGQYIHDYENYAAWDAKSIFLVPNDWLSYDRMEPVIDARYRQFKGEQTELPPAPDKPKPKPKSPWWKFGRT